MMHPDQIYQLRQLRHSDLRMEMEQARARRNPTSGRATWRRNWLVTCLRRLGRRRTSAATLVGQDGMGTTSGGKNFGVYAASSARCCAATRKASKVFVQNLAIS